MKVKSVKLNNSKVIFFIEKFMDGSKYIINSILKKIQKHFFS